MNASAWLRSNWFLPTLMVGALVAAAASYFPALAVINDLRERLTTSRETLARLNRTIKVGQSAVNASDQGASPFTGDFLSGANESLVVAGLQSRLRDLAIQNNVELNSSNNLPARSNRGVTYLGLHIVLRGEIKDIQRVLHVIEMGEPLLFVSRAIMRMDTWPITSNVPERNGQPALVAELDIFGAMAPDRLAQAGPEAKDDVDGSPAGLTDPILSQGR